MALWRCTGFVTKVIEMYVEAETEDEAWQKIEDGDFVEEKDVDVRDVEKERNTLMKVEDFEQRTRFR